MIRSTAVLMAGAMLAACGSTSSEPEATMNNTVDLRHLVETEVAGNGIERYPLEGVEIPTPSDAQSRYEVLRQRRTAGGTIIAILRQQRGNRFVYARTELDCERNLFHVVGVADTRAHVETNVAHDGPLRSTDGLPLRQELSRFICARASA
ncbi:MULTISPECIES: hypothetical protein [unclassified Sphingomonas]|uniref:hypothetical protein n=1 Tax=unclassified Sphingomonas TaxID=196159 RepID=UPI0006F868CE|nr:MULTISPECIES: hypothetical protein [unclassified Sphingomonas]KQM61362.1 hypothetical protein ASE65_07410 [Sphingomonas sp. Leaf16]KQN12457.1 hypothetical protein ASE81_08420 [Sphingomonas sp. Leaf29]KQN18938.1 hypothetical protein ASE83_08345 [Sphingomonas sp. Leaf32]